MKHDFLDNKKKDGGFPVARKCIFLSLYYLKLLLAHLHGDSISSEIVLSK